LAENLSIFFKLLLYLFIFFEQTVFEACQAFDRCPKSGRNVKEVMAFRGTESRSIKKDFPAFYGGDKNR